MPTDKSEYVSEWRRNNPRFKERAAKSERARNRARTRLVELHPVEYEILLADERRKEGLE